MFYNRKINHTNNAHTTLTFSLAPTLYAIRVGALYVRLTDL